tara:strand:- start:3244 stop:4098 length:855 start_codon:yes stop_codon:yes gene_type:complete
MQSSPFYNRGNTTKFNPMNLPKYNSQTMALVKNFDRDTGRTVYSVNKQSQETKNVNNNSMNVNDVSKNYVKHVSEKNAEETLEKVRKDISNMKSDILTEIIEKLPHSNYITEYNSYLQEFLKPNITREYIFSVFNPKLTKLSNSKIYENSKLILFNKNYYTRLDNLTVTINGIIKNNNLPKKLYFNLRFISKSDLNDTKDIYEYKSEVISVEPLATDNTIFISKNFEIQQFIPNSNELTYIFVPSCIIENDENVTLDLDITIKTLYNFSYHNQTKNNFFLKLHE